MPLIVLKLGTLHEGRPEEQQLGIKWDRDNQKCKSYMLNSLGNDLYGVYRKMDNSKKNFEKF